MAKILRIRETSTRFHNKARPDDGSSIGKGMKALRELKKFLYKWVADWMKIIYLCGINGRINDPQ